MFQLLQPRGRRSVSKPSVVIGLNRDTLVVTQTQQIIPCISDGLGPCRGVLAPAPVRIDVSYRVERRVWQTLDSTEVVVCQSTHQELYLSQCKGPVVRITNVACVHLNWTGCLRRDFFFLVFHPFTVNLQMLPNAQPV